MVVEEAAATVAVHPAEAVHRKVVVNTLAEAALQPVVVVHHPVDVVVLLPAEEDLPPCLVKKFGALHEKVVVLHMVAEEEAVVAEDNQAIDWKKADSNESAFFISSNLLMH